MADLSSTLSQVGAWAVWADNDAGGSCYGPLKQLGQWYCEYLSSSVAAERALGVMRAVEAPNRLSMSYEMWRTEMMHRMNKWVVGSDFQAAMNRKESPSQAGTFFLAAVSSSASSAAVPLSSFD